MEYKSPLDNAYGPEKSSEHWPKERYSPYNVQSGGNHSRGRQSHFEESSTHSRQGSSHSRPGSHQQYSYTARYKPTHYPRELTSLFEAAYCRLCDIELLSPVVAKMHYSGKQHYKKVKSFLTEWCSKTGNPMPEISAPNSELRGETLADYCELCDVSLPSINDKLLHFSGKSHRKNERDPVNAKKKRKVYHTTVDMSGRFGIGTSFSGDDEQNYSVNVEENKYVCDLCDVKAVSQDQLNAHLNGKKHKEKMVKKESAVPKPVNPSISVLMSVLKDKPRDSVDYSMHRTPSESHFSCSRCNVTFDDGKLLEMHLKGKRHAKALEKQYMEGADNCKICDISFTSFAHYQSHIYGKKHLKRAKEAELTTVKSLIMDEDKNVGACQVCSFVGNLQDHIDLAICDQSRLKNDGEIDSKYFCQFCNYKTFDSEEEYKKHKTSRTHLLSVVNQEKGDEMLCGFEHWYCVVCKKQCGNPKEYTDHLFEPRHITLSECDIERRTDLFHCTVCNVVMDQEAKEEHSRSRNHLSDSIKKDIKATLTKLANENISTTIYQCSNCDVTLLNFVEYSKHLLGDDHINMMIKLSMDHLDNFKV